MKVKHLIRELQKCDPEAQVTTMSDDFGSDSHHVEDGGNWVVIWNNENWTREPYDNHDDTPQPLPSPTPGQHE